MRPNHPQHPYHPHNPHHGRTQPGQPRRFPSYLGEGVLLVLDLLFDLLEDIPADIAHRDLPVFAEFRRLLPELFPAVLRERRDPQPHDLRDMRLYRLDYT